MNKKIFWAAIVAGGVLLVVNGIRMAFGVFTFPLWVQVGDTICLGLILVATGMERLNVLHRTWKL